MIKMMAHLVTPGGMTGAPRRLLTLSAALQQHALQVTIASESDAQVLQVARERGLQTCAIENRDVLKSRRGSLFKGHTWHRVRVLTALLLQNLYFRTRARETDPDILWFRGAKGIAFAGLGALMCGKPVVWDVDFEPASKGMVYWLHRFGLWLADRVVFQYENAGIQIFGTSLAQRYDHKFVSILPGIDLRPLVPFKERRQQHLEVADKRIFTILQIGTICKRKNQELIVDALKIVSNIGVKRDWSVLFAFDEDQDPDVRANVESSGLAAHVEFLGWRDDVHDLMSKADLLVMPSLDEGVPNTVQEAMYIGLPVLVSNAGGMPDIVQHCVTGWILPLDDPPAWAAQIIACAENPKTCDLIGDAASRYAVAHFGTELWSSRYAEIIRKCSKSKS